MTPIGAGHVPRVVMMENHDGALQAWRDAGVRDRVLLHLDAHHDMWWVSDRSHISIANFIAPALAEGLVRELCWVVPDRTWSRAGLRPVLRHLRQLVRGYPEPRSPIRVSDRSITTTLLGKPVTICTLASTPARDEDVLLDIDVDYLLIPRVSYRALDIRDSLPWCWPEDLIKRLGNAGVQSSLVTVAYSVEGGYTPLRWKYLGDELQARLSTPPDASAIRGFALLRASAVAEERGDITGAARECQEAAIHLRGVAAPHHRLAELALASGQMTLAREHCQRAVATDPSYRTPFSSAGFPNLWKGNLTEAAEGFAHQAALDPEDPWATLGLALVAVRRRRWIEAATGLRSALERDPDLVDAHRALGDVLAREGHRREALAAYGRSLQLTLAGHAPIERPFATQPPAGRLVDPEHLEIHARVAALHAALGDTARAINGYQISIAGGRDGFAPRARLAWLLMTQGRWRAALAQFAMRRSG